MCSLYFNCTYRPCWLCQVLRTDNTRQSLPFKPYTLHRLEKRCQKGTAQTSRKLEADSESEDLVLTSTRPGFCPQRISDMPKIIQETCCTFYESLSHSLISFAPYCPSLPLLQGRGIIFLFAGDVLGTPIPPCEASNPGLKSDDWLAPCFHVIGCFLRSKKPVITIAWAAREGIQLPKLCFFSPLISDPMNFLKSNWTRPDAHLVHFYLDLLMVFDSFQVKQTPVCT